MLTEGNDGDLRYSLLKLICLIYDSEKELHIEETTSHSAGQEFLSFMEPKVSLLCSHHATTGPYPEPDAYPFSNHGLCYRLRPWVTLCNVVFYGT